MLTQIQCDVFKDPSPIIFYQGLNMVLGDGSNSIGKTSLLKIIDFAFGGQYYTDSSSDVFRHIGHHDICFAHRFGDEEFYFRRNTKDYQKIQICNKKFVPQENIDSTAFNKKLKTYFEISCDDISFREMVSLYSRIWNKPNKEVNRPLYLYPNQTIQNSIINLIKTFSLYEKIKTNQIAYAVFSEEAKAFKSAIKYNIISATTTQKEYNDNQKQIENIDQLIDKINKEVSLLSQDTAFLEIQYNDNIFDERARLLNHKSKLIRSLRRIENNISDNENPKVLSDDTFNQLLDFFPTINMERLTSIGNFHNNINRILLSELIEERENIQKDIDICDNQISSLEENIFSMANAEDKTKSLIANIIELTQERKRLTEVNQIYVNRRLINEKKTSNKKDYEELLVDITKDIEIAINEKICEYSSSIESENNKPPILELHPNKYTYSVPDNTGTGKAYTDLILFDLSILSLTQLPIVIHDSFLFNNIGIETMSSFIKLYNQINGKQTFISVDKIGDYESDVQEIIKSTARRYLGNEKHLYREDWR